MELFLFNSGQVLSAFLIATEQQTVQGQTALYLNLSDFQNIGLLVVP
jgi:hypothetical protein